MRKAYPIRHFTLVELLVVIAIISVLASMLLPALQGAKDKAHQSNCVGNLKQWGTAFTMYVEDNERFPHPHTPTPTSVYDSPGRVWPYLPIREAWFCPAELSLNYWYVNVWRKQDPSRWTINSGYWQTPGYGYNWGYVGCNQAMSGGSLYNTAATLTSFKKPANTILGGDCYFGNPVGRIPGSPNVDQVKWGWHMMYWRHRVIADGNERYNTFVGSRHNGTANMAWIDGHVGSHRAPAAFPQTPTNNAYLFSPFRFGEVVGHPENCWDRE